MTGRKPKHERRVVKFLSETVASRQRWLLARWRGDEQGHPFRTPQALRSLCLPSWWSLTGSLNQKRVR